MKNISKKLILALACIGALQPFTTQAGYFSTEHLPTWLSYDKISTMANEQYQNIQTQIANSGITWKTTGIAVALGLGYYTYKNAGPYVNLTKYTEKPAFMSSPAIMINAGLDFVEGMGKLITDAPSYTVDGIAYLHNKLYTQPRIEKQIMDLNWNNPSGLFEHTSDPLKPILPSILTQKHFALIKEMKDLFVIIDNCLLKFCSPISRSYQSDGIFNTDNIQIKANVTSTNSTAFDEKTNPLIKSLQKAAPVLKTSPDTLEFILINEIKGRIKLIETEINKKYLNHDVLQDCANRLKAAKNVLDPEIKLP
ncbi:MAG: hypothetical protein WCE21_05810 [Candidatus Babeliales bacterium]